MIAALMLTQISHNAQGLPKYAKVIVGMVGLMCCLFMLGLTIYADNKKR